MSNPSGYPGFQADSRGNRLEWWTATQAQGGHLLWLRGPTEAAGQVCATAPWYRRQGSRPTG